MNSNFKYKFINNLLSFYLFLGDSAKAYFEKLKKKYNKKKNTLKKARNKSGSDSHAAINAQRALNPYKFLSWLDDFVYVRESRTNVFQISDENKEDFSESEEENVDEDEKSDDSDQEYNYGDENYSETASTSSLLSPTISSTPLQKTAPTLQPPKKRTKISENGEKPKKLSKTGKGTKNNYMEEMELNLIRDLGKSIKNDSNQLNKPDDIDLYTKSLAADLRKLSEREYAMVKNEFQGILFRYQMARFGQAQSQGGNQWQGSNTSNNAESLMNSSNGQYVRWVNSP